MTSCLTTVFPSSRVLHKNFLNNLDTEWSPICLSSTTSTKTNATYVILQLDGRGIAAQLNSFVVASDPLDGDLTLGRSGAQSPIYLSKVNVWDRSLTSGDLYNYRDKCAFTRGNILSWEEFRHKDVYKDANYTPPFFNCH